MLCQSPQQTTNGSVQIGFSHEKVVWDMLFKLLEIRMQAGEFTVIDATNSKSEEMNKYKNLASKYRYRIYLLDLTGIPIDVCKARNAQREELKRVPDDVDDKMYARFETQKVPSGITVIKPKDPCNVTGEDIEQIWLKPIDLSNYRKIVHIGDVHGCYTVLQKYLHGQLEDDVFYIFLGDYLDRGVENVEVLKYLLEIKDKKNVLLLTGNHEVSIYNYAHDIPAKSREFEWVTKNQLNSANFDKKDLSRLYYKLVQCAWYKFHDKEVFVCHGGISFMPENVTLVASEQMIKGVGRYEDYLDVANAWEEKSGGVYQIFGHRNTQASEIHVTPHVFNLEGRVEFGGCLRVVELDHEGFKPIEIKNTVFRKKEEFELQNALNSSDLAKLVLDMRASKYIHEKKFENNISSFNFSSDAFKKGIWNNLTVHARGLFIDLNRIKVCARGYLKMSYLDGTICPTFAELKDVIKYPISVYVKENGFLGMLSYDEYADDFRYCTKSMVGGEYAGWFKEIFFEVTTEDARKNILQYLKDNDCTFVFEVEDSEKDPHIIKYLNHNIILLDIVKNDIVFNKLPYNDMVDLAVKFGLTHKRKVCNITNWEEFCEWYSAVQKQGYKLLGEYVEGFVVEDSGNLMFKVKTEYYNFWKRMRSIASTTLRRGYIEGTGQLINELDNKFYGFLRKMYDETEDKESLLGLDIITLRDKFYENYE